MIPIMTAKVNALTDVMHLMLLNCQFKHIDLVLLKILNQGGISKIWMIVMLSRFLE